MQFIIPPIIKEILIILSGKTFLISSLSLSYLVFPFKSLAVNWTFDVLFSLKNNPLVLPPIQESAPIKINNIPSQNIISAKE